MRLCAKEDRVLVLLLLSAPLVSQLGGLRLACELQREQQSAAARLLPCKRIL